MIRDRLVCGINDIAIQKRLLAVTYAKAIEIAQATETAVQSLLELRSKPEEGRASPKSVVHRTTARRRRLQSFVFALAARVTRSREMVSGQIGCLPQL